MKMILGNLLPKVLDDEESLKSFVFFLNKLENIRRPKEDIYSVLDDYLALCNNLPIKGKKRVMKISDQYIFHCEDNVGFIDAIKIELIANAALNKTGIKLNITIHDFKRRYKKNILRNNKMNNAYRDLMEQYQEGDAIEELITPHRSWKQLCGRAAVVLTRNGEYVFGIKKSMN